MNLLLSLTNCKITPLIFSFVFLFKICASDYMFIFTDWTYNLFDPSTINDEFMLCKKIVVLFFWVDFFDLVSYCKGQHFRNR